MRWVWSGGSVMKTRHLAFAVAFIGMMSAATTAEALVGQTTGSVNMRTGPSTAYPVVLTIPAGAQINVGQCSSWCSVSYGGFSGWASASYIATGYYEPRYQPPPAIVAPPAYYPADPRFYEYYSEPPRQSRRNGRWVGY